MFSIDFYSDKRLNKYEKNPTNIPAENSHSPQGALCDD